MHVSKNPLGVSGEEGVLEVELELELGARILAVEKTSRGPALFALEGDGEKVTRHFFVVQDRVELPDELVSDGDLRDGVAYIDSVKFSGREGYHVFEATQVLAL